MPAEITLSACKYFSVKSKQGYMNGCFYAFDRRLPAGPCKPGCYVVQGDELKQACPEDPWLKHARAWATPSRGMSHSMPRHAPGFTRILIGTAELSRGCVQA